MAINVLIVEDELLIATDIKEILITQGYDVAGVADNCKDALKIIENNKVDVALMDIKIKGEFDGIETAEKIKEKYKLPIIFLSAFSDSNTVSKAKLIEPDAYITKPIDRNELFSSLEIVLYKHEIDLKLRESEELLSVTLDNIEGGILTVDNDLNIKFMNPASIKMLKIEKNIVGKSLNKYLYLNDEFGEKIKLNNLISSEIKDKTFLLNQNKNKKFLPIELSIYPLNNMTNEQNGWIFYIKNIEYRARIEEMNSRLISIVEFSDDAIIGADKSGKIKSWNSGAEKIFGYSKDEIIGKNLYILTPNFYPNEIPGIIEMLKKNKKVEHYESLRKTKDSNIINVSITISVIKNKYNKLQGFSFIAKDITGKKNLEREILEIGDRERTRIGQDLHDSIGQQLTGVLFSTKVLENQLSDDSNSDVKKQIKTITQLVRDTIMQTRDIAKTLVPVILESEGLYTALKELSDFSGKMLGVKTIFHGDESIEINDMKIVSNIYRITQEAINNANKHGNASEINIELIKDQGDIVLSVSNNGDNLIENEKSSGIGLKIMKYRSDIFNGQFQIYNRKEGGVTVKCRVPLSVIGGFVHEKEGNSSR